MSGFSGWTIAQFHDAFRRGAVSPIEVARWTIDEANATNGRLGTVLTFIADDDALAMASAAERRWHAGQPLGMLDGVPVTIKNLLGVTGWPLDFCSLTVDPASRANFDAPAVARLREAGAVFIGYTATPEFSWKLVTDSPKYGAVRNPADLSRTAGGSSGGAAVCAAIGLAPIHLATDAAGSIRVPASYCGVFGMKPTFGTVAAYPAGSLTHIGPLARDPADAVILLDTIGQPDRRDWYNTPFMEHAPFSRALDLKIETLRIAFAPRLAGMEPSAEVLMSVTRAVRLLEEMGAVVEEVTPEIIDPREVARVYFSGGYVQRLHSMAADARTKIDPGLVDLVSAAERFTAQDVWRAQQERYQLGSQVSTFFETFDLLVTPTTIGPAFELGRNMPPGNTDDLSSWSAYTYIFNLTQNPAASLPCGTTTSGLPVGLQIVGPKFHDAHVLGASVCLASRL